MPPEEPIGKDLVALMTSKDTLYDGQFEEGKGQQSDSL